MISLNYKFVWGGGYEHFCDLVLLPINAPLSLEEAV